MRKLTAVLLLSILGIILFPWQTICIVHPPATENHHHKGPSSCEIHRIAVQQKGEHFSQKMECKHVQSQIYDLQNHQVENVAPGNQLFVILPVDCESVKLGNHKQPFSFPPDPQCRSATLISDNPLRGPPLV